jgi:hypothetical protein
MPGETTTAALQDSLPTMRMGARMVKEQKGRLRDFVDSVQLGKGMGTSWSEVDFAKINAQSVSETTDLRDNPQQLVDALTSIKPTDCGIHVLYTDIVGDKVIAQAASIVRSGALGMAAIMRKDNLDGITQGRSATTDLGTAGNPLASSLIRHLKYRISSNVTEPNPDGPFHFIHHGFALADIDDELSAPLGTYPITSGLSEEVIINGYGSSPRMIGGVFVHEMGDLTIDGSDDCEGFGFARDGMVHVEGLGLRTEAIRVPGFGGGATSVYMYYDYAWGFRSSGNWLFSATADATAPA